MAGFCLHDRNMICRPGLFTVAVRSRSLGDADKLQRNLSLHDNTDVADLNVTPITIQPPSLGSH